MSALYFPFSLKISNKTIFIDKNLTNSLSTGACPIYIYFHKECILVHSSIFNFFFYIVNYEFFPLK